ncbi:MAG: HEAT repeat domain-containing protein, partial [Candidatus Electrothrix sp. AR3]|nr:HEAT repeat domain-containing protein [Candidatus Electrothrix sp. AR3]
NWRSEVDSPLDPREALPQLEYLAYAMCAEGIQQIREDQVLNLLHRVREEYPNIYPLRQHSPEEFLGLLERRTGLLIQSGHTRHKGRSRPVYEFRHLTFQEYLAGIALLQGHYQGRDKNKSLAEVIAPLAGQMEMYGEDHEKKVKENWREALRLCLAACNDDADAALLAILHPLPKEIGTAHARAVQALLCLADEPYITEKSAKEVMKSVVGQVQEGDAGGVLLFPVATVSSSRWAEPLGEYLLDEFFQRDEVERLEVGWLFAFSQNNQRSSDEAERFSWLIEQTVYLNEFDERRAAGISLLITKNSLFFHDNCNVPGIVDGLICCLSGSAALSCAAGWALSSINNEIGKEEHVWHPSRQQLEQLLAVATSSNCNSEILPFLYNIFGNEKTLQAVDILKSHFSISNSSRSRQAIINALGNIGDLCTTKVLIECLHNTNETSEVRQTAAESLGKIGDDQALDALLALLNNIIEDDWEVRQEAAKALGEIGGEQVLNVLLERVQDIQEEPGVCLAAINALGEIGDKLAVDILLVRLIDTDQEENIRRAATRALEKIGGEQAQEILTARLENEEEQGVRQEAARALGKIGGEQILPVLKPYLQDADREIRRAVLSGLAQTCEDEIDRKLLTKNFYGFLSWLDPQTPITAARVTEAAKKLKLPAEEITRRYATLAKRFGLQLEAGILAREEEDQRK